MEVMVNRGLMPCPVADGGGPCVASSSESTWTLAQCLSRLPLSQWESTWSRVVGDCCQWRSGSALLEGPSPMIIGHREGVALRASLGHGTRPRLLNARVSREFSLDGMIVAGRLLSCIVERGSAPGCLRWGSQRSVAQHDTKLGPWELPWTNCKVT